MSYELVCGIECHVELLTVSKIFCSCKTAFNSEPNTQCCPVCTGQPGTLPVLNREAVRLAIRAGLALNCKINTASHMDRKNYFYPDLPKAYQISQLDEPLCTDGYIKLDSGKIIRIERIHIEEDAGKLVHENGYTYIDYNRAGVPLIEIVSKPDITTPEEAKEYGEKLRLIMKSAGISDCKMQEGSVRFDVNLSLHKAEEPLGTRTEIKNIGSLSNIVKAMRAEAKRQEKILESGGSVKQCTMRYDEANDCVYILRVKENSDDYRFFPEPDIPFFKISEAELEEIKKEMPELPDKRLERYIKKLLLPKNKAELLIKYSGACAYFDSAVAFGADANNALNLILSVVFAQLRTDSDKESFNIPLKAEEFAKLVRLNDERKLTASKTKDTLIKLITDGGALSDYITDKDLAAMSDVELLALCEKAVGENPCAVSDILSGKDKAKNVLIGSVMRLSKGRADVKAAEKILAEILAKKAGK